MKKKKIYELNEEDVKSLVAVLMLRFLVGTIAEDRELLNPDNILNYAFELLDRKKDV